MPPLNLSAHTQQVPGEAVLKTKLYEGPLLGTATGNGELPFSNYPALAAAEDKQKLSPALKLPQPQVLANIFLYRHFMIQDENSLSPIQ